MAELLQIGRRPTVAPPQVPSRERVWLERRAKMLAWGGNAWHLIEFAIAVVAGWVAGSVALIGFGADSLIEFAAGSVIVWLFTGGRGSSQRAERRAQQLIAASYFLLAVYIGVESVRDLVGGHHPATSWVGIGLAAFTAPTMPLLARAKRRVGRKLSSSAAVSESNQNMICAYLSIALLVGLSLNTLAGWWWADPAAALVIGAVALREGVESWRGKNCDCCLSDHTGTAAPKIHAARDILGGSRHGIPSSIRPRHRLGFCASSQRGKLSSSSGSSV